MIKAIIFDYDGVIVQGDIARFEFLKKAFQNRNVTLQNSLFQKTIGHTTEYVFKNIIADSIEEEIKGKVLNEYNTEYKQNITEYLIPIPTTVRCIKEYKGNRRLVIASNSGRNTVTKSLKYLGILDKFSFIVTKEMVKKPKPDPEIYHKTIETLGLQPNDVIVIEDSVVGATAALKAGATCYIILNSINTPDEFAALPIGGYIRNLEDYNTILQS